VRKNLFEFLEIATELYPDERLWIDALCIRQDDTTEKNHQVERMGLIYYSATEVLVWLGRSLYLHASGDSLSEEVCRHAYWTRAWIAQEILLQNNIKLLVARDWIDFVSFGRALAGPPSQNKIGMSMPEKLFRAWCRTFHFENLPLYWDFWDLLVLRSESQCADVRDRIYSLLALTEIFGQPKRLAIDYNEETTGLFWRVCEVYEMCCKPSCRKSLMGALELTVIELEESLERKPDTNILIPIVGAYYALPADSLKPLRTSSNFCCPGSHSSPSVQLFDDDTRTALILCTGGFYEDKCSTGSMHILCQISEPCKSWSPFDPIEDGELFGMIEFKVLAFSTDGRVQSVELPVQDPQFEDHHDRTSVIYPENKLKLQIRKLLANMLNINNLDDSGDRFPITSKKSISIPAPYFLEWIKLDTLP
jgi:hypothetical protein